MALILPLFGFLRGCTFLILHTRLEEICWGYETFSLHFPGVRNISCVSARGAKHLGTLRKFPPTGYAVLKMDNPLLRARLQIIANLNFKQLAR